VIDRSGRPITDLKQGDFSLLEDGAPQEIRYFSSYALAPETPQPGTTLPVRQAAPLSPQHHRLFLIALGLGRLEDPSQTISGLLRFVRTRLLPQDQVALFAYDRGLPFTTDHEKVAQALERAKRSHQDIDFELGLQLGPTGMASLYGTRVLPRKLQTRIDEMVLGPGAKPPVPPTAEILEPETFANLSLDDFMAACALTLQDQSNLMALVEYLRHFEGEKHLLFVTEKGLLWPNEDNDRSLAQVANDGRVSIHTLQAGGLLAVESGKGEISATEQQSLSFRSLRNISNLTGGLPAITERGQSALDRLDEVTRTGYLLGFRSSVAAWDGGHRALAVRVNRPDVTVLFRHGYDRDQSMPGFNRRGSVTNDRLAAAGNFRREVNDIKVKVGVSVRAGGLAADGKIDLSKVKLILVDGARVGLLNIAVFCLDSGGNPMGTHVQSLPLKLTEEDYTRAQKDGMPFTIQFPMIRGVQTVRFIVYDFASDLVGRVDTRVY
jgi:VWFA-related protein